MIMDLHDQRANDAIRFIMDFQEKEGISPTIREIQKHLGVSSTSTAFSIIKDLKRRGWITSKRNCPRTITVTIRKDTLRGEQNNG